MMDKNLVQVADPDLDRLAWAIEHKQLGAIERTSLLGIGLGHIYDHVAWIAALPPESVIAVIRAARAERQHRRGPLLELVWTGPEAKASEARDSAVVLRELFERAQQTVILAGYSFDAGAELFRPLHAAMAVRGVRTSLFLDINGDAVGAEPLTIAGAAISAFLADNWPFGDPIPTIYYDPRSATRGGYASLHAKCVIVDERLALVTSANFTDRGNTRNIEVGVLVDDSGFAGALARQWLSLADAGLVSRWNA